MKFTNAINFNIVINDFIFLLKIKRLGLIGPHHYFVSEKSSCTCNWLFVDDPYLLAGQSL